MVDKNSETISRFSSTDRVLSASNLNRIAYAIDKLERQVSLLENELSTKKDTIVLYNDVESDIEAFTLVPIVATDLTASNTSDLYRNAGFKIVGHSTGLFAITQEVIKQESIGHGKLTGISLCRIKDPELRPKGFYVRLTEEFTGSELAAISNIGDWVALDYVKFGETSEYYAIVYYVPGFHLVKNTSAETIPAFSFFQYKNALEIEKPTEGLPVFINDGFEIKNNSFALIKSSLPKWVITHDEEDKLVVGSMVGPLKASFSGKYNHGGYEAISFVEHSVLNYKLVLVKERVLPFVYKVIAEGVSEVTAKLINSEGAVIGPEIVFKVLD